MGLQSTTAFTLEGRIDLKLSWERENPAEASWLRSNSHRGGFFADLAAQLDRRGSLSEKQTACITRQMARDAEWSARREEEAALLVDAPVITAGKYAVTGTILHRRIREVEWGTQDKILLRTPDGNKFWVTTPKALAEDVHPDDLVGMDAVIIATWTPSPDDPHFAFGQRPKCLSH